MTGSDVLDALKQQGVRIVRVTYPDLHGVLRGKDAAAQQAEEKEGGKADANRAGHDGSSWMGMDRIVPRSSAPNLAAHLAAVRRSTVPSAASSAAQPPRRVAPAPSVDWA